MKLLELTEDLVKQVPVWIYRGEADTSAEVEPTELVQLHEESSVVYIAQTTFQFPNGATLTGYCSPIDPSGLDYLQPVILVGSRHIPTFSTQSGRVLPLNESLEGLGLVFDRVFPIAFRCEIPVSGQIVCGIIESDPNGAA